MEFTDVKTFIDENKESADVKKYLEGMNPLVGLSTDNVHSFVENNPVLKSYRDAHATKAMTSFEEKFKSEKLPGLILEKYNTDHPPETEEKKELRELRLRVESAEKKTLKSELTALAVTSANEVGLPVKLVKYFIGDDEDSTNRNMGNLKTEFEAAVTAEVEKRLADNTRNPHDVNLMIEGGKNPFKPEYYNMTQQLILKKNNPELYNKYKKAAGY